MLKLSIQFIFVVNNVVIPSPKLMLISSFRFKIE